MSIGKTFRAVTPSDTDELGKDDSKNWPDAIRFGTGGDAVLVAADGAQATFVNIADGETIPCSVRKIMATGTTAADIVAIYV